MSLAKKNSREYYGLLFSSVYAYRFFSVASFLLLSLFLFGYLKLLAIEKNSLEFYFINALIIILSVSIEFLCRPGVNLLRVLSKVDKMYFALFIQRITQLFLVLLLLNFFNNLYIFSFSVLIGTLLKYFYIAIITKKYFPKKNIKFNINVLMDMFRSSNKLILIDLSNFFTFRSIIYFANYFVGSKVGSFIGILQNIAQISQSLSDIFFNINYTKYLNLFRNNKFIAIKKLANKTILFTLTLFSLLFIFGVLSFVILNKFILSYKFEISLNIIFIYWGVFLLSLNLNYFWRYLSLDLNILFLKSALISSIFILISQFITGFYYKDLLILILCQGAVQLIYNGWRWPLFFYQQLALKKI
jgi:O-antigen/teichoic acid export membrane protein